MNAADDGGCYDLDEVAREFGVDLDEDANAAYVHVANRPVHRTVSLYGDTVMADLAADGTLIGVEVLGNDE